MSTLDTHHHSSWLMIGLTGAAAALALLLAYDPGVLRFSDGGGPIRARAVPQVAATGPAVSAADFQVLGSPNHRTLAPRSATVMKVGAADAASPRPARANGVRVPPK